MLATTTADFLWNKKQSAEYLRTVAYSMKSTFHQKCLLGISIFTILNDKLCIYSHLLFL